MKNEIKQSLYCPNQFDNKKLLSLGLIDESGNLNNQYYLLEQTYKKLLEEYLDNKLNLSKYDNVLSTSPLKFNQVPEAEKDIYQQNSKYQYLYIRNTLYLEQLSPEELSYLSQKGQTNDLTLDEATISFITKTLPIVTNSNPESPSMLTNYGPLNQEYFAPNMAIVIGMRYNPYEDETSPEYDDDKWFENNMAQTQFLAQFFKQMRMEVNVKLPIPVSVIQYDEDSVMLEKKTDTPRLI